MQTLAMTLSWNIFSLSQAMNTIHFRTLFIITFLKQKIPAVILVIFGQISQVISLDHFVTKLWSKSGWLQPSKFGWKYYYPKLDDWNHPNLDDYYSFHSLYWRNMSFSSIFSLKSYASKNVSKVDENRYFHCWNSYIYVQMHKHTYSHTHVQHTHIIMGDIFYVLVIIATRWLYDNCYYCHVW